MSRNHSLDHTVIERNRRARDEFLSGASPSPFIIEPAIVRAWQRCVRIGVEPERPVEFKAVHANERRAAIDANRSLVEAAGDELDRLGRAMVPSGASVILADMSLVTIGVRGRPAAMAREMQVACREGVDLSEPSIGSNALTIAAIEQSPSIVLNNAHFCSMNAIFACAAAPIRSPVGALLGVIDVTTCHQPLPAEAPFLVNASARAIENAIFARDTERTVVRFHPRADLLGTPMEAVILCSPDGDIVGANEAALGLLGLRWPLRGAHFSRSFRLAFGELLARAGRREFAALTLVSASGVPLHAQVAMPMREPVRSRALAAGGGICSGEPTVGESAFRAGGPAVAAGATASPAFPAAASDPDPDPIGRFAVGDDTLRLQLWRAAQGLAAGLPVLVQGESGTGTLLAARVLHEAGPQPGPFVVIDCASLADAHFDERLAACAGGTCVLDEVSDLAEGLQARLLRLLQQREAIRPAGAPAAAFDGAVAARPYRLISTSRSDLHRCCEAGRFRYDLHYRLQRVRVELPALRHHADRGALLIGAAGEADGDGEVGRLRDLQYRAITRAIDKHHGNLSQAARELGVSRGTLYRRLKALGEGG